MRLAGQILGVVVGAVLVFMALSMTENWAVFAPYFAGKSAPAPLPAHEKIEAVLRAFNEDVERGVVAGRPGHPARTLLERDQAFRSGWRIGQRLRVVEFAIESTRRSGPRRVGVSTRERSTLEIARAGAPVRRFELSGTWEYVLLEGPEGLEVLDVQPHHVRLEPVAEGAPQ